MSRIEALRRSDIDENALLLTDSYKVTHWKQYPPATTGIYSYFESRGGVYENVLFFGLQYIMQKYLVGEVVTQAKINEAEEIIGLHLGSKSLFNRKGWEHILDDHGGKLPVSISAVAEGAVIPTHNALVTVENTCPKCFWLTNYLETLLVQVWYPSTVATISMTIKGLISKYLDETGDPSIIDFKLHDFGFRGTSSVESAAIGGAAHLVNFKGTDTMVALMLHRKYYGATMAGFSIPAAEHSTITAWRRALEEEAFKNMLNQFPTGLVAVVSDSYNIYEACEKIWGEKLHDAVKSRDGTVVVRPDSGYPPEVVLKVLDILGGKFGYITNAKGYRVLDSHIRVIQGDGIDYDMIDKILGNLKEHGWSADNVAFGMGGALLQRLDRDTQKCAFKCSSATVNGEDRDVFKQPITDPGKNSKAGRLALVFDEQTGAFKTVRESRSQPNRLQEVFRDGKILVHWDLDGIRLRAQEASPKTNKAKVKG